MVSSLVASDTLTTLKEMLGSVMNGDPTVAERP
jgi:hypothetical protein